MTDGERAKLDLADLDDDDTAPTAMDPAVIKDTAAKAGFHETARPAAARKPRSPKPPAPPSAATEAAPARRRTRRKTGRIHQFGTRLDKATLDAIYAYADRHDLLIAQVIERAMEALSRAENGRRRAH